MATFLKRDRKEEREGETGTGREKKEGDGRIENWCGVGGGGG